MFDRIWEAITAPDTRKETPQFRFWVRKMFTLGIPKPVNVSPAVTSILQPVLLHHDIPVAIQEQLYELLCYCHALCGHGGRDKTRAVVYKYYSWVPKALISKFIKVCPTCILKKKGELYNAEKLEGQTVIQSSSQLALQDMLRTLSALDEDELASAPRYLLPTGSTVNVFLDNSGPETIPSSSAVKPTFKLSAVQDLAASLLPLASRERSSLAGSSQSHAMSREVSLYKGLPNGWQYFSDYPEAYTKFIKDKENLQPLESGPLGEYKSREKRPRVPSIAPMAPVPRQPSETNVDAPPRICCPDGTITPLSDDKQSASASTSRSSMSRCEPRIDPALLNPTTSPVARRPRPPPLGLRSLAPYHGPWELRTQWHGLNSPLTPDSASSYSSHSSESRSPIEDTSCDPLACAPTSSPSRDGEEAIQVGLVETTDKLQLGGDLDSQ